MKRTPFKRKPGKRLRARLGPTQQTDAVFSRLIKGLAQWKCERCGRDFSENQEWLDCSHFFRRSIAATRYDRDNCDAICRDCHTGPNGFEFDKDGAYAEFKRGKLGMARYYALMYRGNEHVKMADARRAFLESLDVIEAREVQP